MVFAGAPTPSLTRARLVNGSGPCSGRVEVFHDSRWGTVCDDGWNLLDAEVVCREVGCGSALSAFPGAAFGQGAGPIWLDEMTCAGTEASLSLCQASVWGSHNCKHNEDAGVECSGNCPPPFFFFFPFFKGLVEKKEEFEMILGVDIYIVALQMELGGNL